jgi:hypothetical protein
VKKLALVLAFSIALPIVSADAAICHLGRGVWVSGRCPDYVAANGRWHRNRVYCLYNNGQFRHWGHCR